MVEKRWFISKRHPLNTGHCACVAGAEYNIDQILHVFKSIVWTLLPYHLPNGRYREKERIKSFQA